LTKEESIDLADKEAQEPSTTVRSRNRHEFRAAILCRYTMGVRLDNQKKK